MVALAALAASAAVVPVAAITDLSAHQIGCQFGQPVVVPLRPAIFNCEVSTLNVTGFV
jgi:hypothetical protein